MKIDAVLRIAGSWLVLGGLLAAAALVGPVRVEAQEKAVPQPKDKEKAVDYEALLNDRLSDKVTPEKNAAVLIWKALGPTPSGGDGMPAAYFKRLGMNEPLKNGDYFIGFTTYLKEHIKPATDDFSTFWDQQSWAAKRLWEEKEYPQIAAWLKTNEKPLTLMIEACQRPDYYNPLVSRRAEDQPGMIMGALLPAAQVCREVAMALVARAMLSTHAGKLEAAWRDLLACHRLGRLVARGGTAIEELIGIAIDQVAINAELAFLEAAGLPSKSVMERLKDLQSLPPMPSMAEKVDLTERFTMLQCVQMIRRDAPNTLFGKPDKNSQPMTEDARKAWAMLDWEPAIKSLNTWYDRAAAIIRIADRAERGKEFDTFEKELKERVKSATTFEELAKQFKTVNGINAGVPQRITDHLLGLLMPAFRKIADAHDRSLQNERNLHLAYALAAYRVDQGRYPAKLADLTPKYLAVIPDDLFSGKPLIYRPSDKGYLLYSVGINGKDEDGRTPEDNPQDDDLRVKMPLPPVKK